MTKKERRHSGDCLCEVCGKYHFLKGKAVATAKVMKILTPELFHNTYEKEARISGWETHKKCFNKSFDELPETNQEAMINTIFKIKNYLKQTIEEDSVR